MPYDPLAFRHHLLPSGIRLWYQHRPLAFSRCRVQVHAGSRRDPQGKLELMHLLEHLVGADMRGIPSRTLTQLERWLAEERFDCMLGMTTLDATVYDGQSANDRFEGVMRFLHQLTLQPTLASQLDKERDIIRREREEAATPKERRTEDARGKAVFGDDLLARSFSWAEDHELDRLTIDDARAAHHRWYHPANMSLIIVGGIDEDAALRSAESLFVRDSRAFVAPDPLPPRTFALPKRRKYRQRVEGKVELVELNVWWHMPLCNAQALNIATDALEERLTDRIREKQRASYGVSIDTDATADHRICGLTTNVQPDHVKRTRRIIMEELKRLADFDDLTRFRERSELGYEFMEPDIDTTVEFASDCLTIHGKTLSVADAVANLRAVTVEDVRHVAREHLSPERAYVEIVEK